jgi:hypothetical protein
MDHPRAVIVVEPTAAATALPLDVGGAQWMGVFGLDIDGAKMRLLDASSGQRRD